MNDHQRKQIEEALADLPPKEAQETLRAIMVGEVDALVVESSSGPAVYTLKDANHPYRVIIERMSEGAVVLGCDGTILYCNRSFAAFVGADKSTLLGRPMLACVAPEHHRRLSSVLALARSAPAAADLDLVNRQGILPAYLSASPLDIDDWKSCIALVVTDLTLRRRSEYIAAAEEFARSVLDQAAEPIIVRDAEGIVTHASLAAQALCTSSPLGRPFDDAFPISPTEIKEDGHGAEDIGNPQGIAVQMTCREGKIRHFLAREGKLKDARGKVIGRIVTLADITDRKAAEARASQQEIQFRQLSESLPQLVWTCSADGRCDYFSPQWVAYTGAPAEEHYGLGWREWLHPDERPAASAAWRVANEQRITFDVEYRLRRHDGIYRWFRARAVPFLGEGGQILKWFGTCTDFDDLKRASEALQESEARFRLMADSAPVMIWVAGPDRLCVWFNQHWLAFTGRTMHQEMGSGWAEGVHPEDLEGCLRVYENAFERRKPFTMEYRMRRHDGKYRWILDHGVPRLEADERFAGYIGTGIDITEEKRAKEAIQDLNDDLEKRVRLRTQELEHSHDALVKSNVELQRFAYIAAHDLQTPLRSIASFTQLAMMRLKGKLDAETGEFMQRVSENTTRMHTLINDLLTYSKLDSQARPFEATDMGRLCEEATSSMAATIKESGANVTCDELPTLFVDRSQIAQVLTNLIENGIKYNQSEQIEIRVSARRENKEWIFAVSDNGIGIDPRYQAQIFTVFKRLHAYHEYPGSGVGLAICQQVVEHHGGRIGVESAPGKGSVFYFALPAISKEAE